MGCGASSQGREGPATDAQPQQKVKEQLQQESKGSRHSSGSVRAPQKNSKPASRSPSQTASPNPVQSQTSTQVASASRNHGTASPSQASPRAPSATSQTASNLNREVSGVTAAAAVVEAEQRRRRLLEAAGTAQKLTLQHNLLVQGRPLGWTHAVLSSHSEDVSALEFEQLLKVWHEEWHCFPAWRDVVHAVSAVYKAGLQPLWLRMSNAERRLAAELAVWRLTELTLSQPLFSKAFAEKLQVLLDRCEQHRSKPVVQKEGDSLALVQPEEEPVPRAPVFINSNDVSHFIQRHGLLQLGQQGAVPKGRMQATKGRFPSLDGPLRGRVHNLTVRDVLERIIMPALEATGGLSYAEVFLSNTASEQSPKPNLPDDPGVLVPVPLDMDIVDLHRSLNSSGFLRTDQDFTRRRRYKPRPLWVDVFCEPQPKPNAQAAVPPAPVPRPDTGCLLPASTLAGLPATNGQPEPAGSEGGDGPTPAQSSTAAPSHLELCKVVAILAGPAWPWLPDQLPPSLTDPGCVRQITVARQRGMRALLLAGAFGNVEIKLLGEVDPDVLEAKVWEGACAPSPALVSKAVEQLEAMSGDRVSPPAGLATGVDAQVAAELWKAYVAGARTLQAFSAKMWRPHLPTCDQMSSPSALVPGNAGLRVTRTLVVEAPVPDPEPADLGPKDTATIGAPPAVAQPGTTGSEAVGGERAEVVLELVLEEQLVCCPPDMPQSEVDELFDIWHRDWKGLPSFSTVLRAWTACGGGAPGSMWAAMSKEQRRTAVELVALYGDAAATWRPSPEAEARDRAVSSRGAFVSSAFLQRFAAVHGMRPDKTPSGDNTQLTPTVPGQDAWDPIAFTASVTTSWVCANIVLPATKAYAMCYSDLFLSADAQATLQPQDTMRYCGAADSTPCRAFASHSWACPFAKFIEALTESSGVGQGDEAAKGAQSYWIDIFHKNQWQPVGISDLANNLTLAGRLAAVVHPFPKPLIITRVWCLFEFMTALQLQVPLRLHFTPEVESGILSKVNPSADASSRMTIIHDLSHGLSEELEAEAASLDVSTAQATVPADKDMILDMIREGLGMEEMNRQIRELFRQLMKAALVNENGHNMLAFADAISACFVGDGLVLRQQVGSRGKVAWAPVVTRKVNGSKVISCQSSRHRQRSGRRRHHNHLLGVKVVGSRRSCSQVGSGRLCRVADLRPGDRIRTAGGGVSTVVLVTVDPVGPEGVELCRLPCGGGAGRAGGRLLVTPDHPVLVDGVWRLPRNLVPVERLSAQQVPYGCVFNLELEPPTSLDVSGVVLVSLGQDTSRDVRQGVDPASDELYGWGWRQNPHRARYLTLRSQEELCKLRQEWRWLAGGPELGRPQRLSC